MPEQKQPLPVAQAIAASTDSIELVQSNGVVEFASPVRIVGAAAALGVPELDSRYSLLPVTVSADYTAHVGELVLANTGTAGFTVTLPATPGNQARVQVKNSGNKTLTVVPSSGDTIDGRASEITTGQNIVILYVYNLATTTWIRTDNFIPYIGLTKQVATDTLVAGANTNFVLRIANQLMATAAPDGEHDLVIIAAKNVTGLNAGADYDIRLERESGTTGVLFINLPMKTSTDFIFTDAANSEQFRISHTGGTALLAASLVGNQGANKNLIVNNGGSSGKIQFNSSTGTEFMKIEDTGITFPNNVDIKITGASGGQYASLSLSTGNTLSLRQSGSGKFRVMNSSFNAEAFSVSNAGNVGLGLTAPAAGATDGFPYLPSTAGAPSGTPTALAGFVPFRYDSTNHKLWIYDSGWKGVVVS